MNGSSAMRRKLNKLACRYETAEFLEGDPSSFMHRAKTPAEAEITAFIASCLSFGARKQFMGKIDCILDRAGGDVAGWISEGRYASEFSEEDGSVFYRFYSRGDMARFFGILREVVETYGSLGDALRVKCLNGGAAVGKAKCIDAIRAVQKLFAATPLVPGSATSCCKRLCMFMRWMVRTSSHVDLGLWSDFIDRGSLIIPLDTHVMRVSKSLGLLAGRTATLSAAIKLTEELSRYFPGDPLRGDFALFGAGVNGAV